MHKRPTRSCLCCNVNVRKARAQSDWADPRTTVRRDLADAMVVSVGHEHVATRIDGHAKRIVEAGAGPEPVGIRTIGAADSARKYCNHCPPTIQHRNPLPNPPPPTTTPREPNRQNILFCLIRASRNVRIRKMVQGRKKTSSRGQHTTKIIDGRRKNRASRQFMRVHAGAQTSICAQQTRRVIGPIRVPPPAVTLRMRWFSQSPTNKLPLASTATQPGRE